MQPATNLTVWHRAMDATVRIHRLMRHFRKDSSPGLANQVCRAAASIPANIAEGAGQETPAQFIRFIGYAIGSCAEVESHLVLLGRLAPELTETTQLIDELGHVRRMLYGLRRTLHARQLAARPPH
jgi:four helix bundle protein